jgi:hypothetical protein
MNDVLIIEDQYRSEYWLFNNNSDSDSEDFSEYDDNDSIQGKGNIP